MAARHIDIQTSQNAILSYELAPLILRILSNMADSGIVLLFLGLTVQNFWLKLLMPSFILQYSGLVWFYHLIVIIALGGKSIGMRVLDLQIINTGGESVDFFTYFLRWIIRPIDITFSGGSIAVFSILGSPQNQRLGDMFAGTVVIKTKTANQFTLNEIVAYHENKTENKIVFPAVKNISEEDMLFIKNLIQDKGKYDHNIHRSALNKAAAKMEEILNIKNEYNDSKLFLQQLVKDYINITR